MRIAEQASNNEQNTQNEKNTNKARVKLVDRPRVFGILFLGDQFCGQCMKYGSVAFSVVDPCHLTAVLT